MKKFRNNSYLTILQTVFVFLILLIVSCGSDDDDKIMQKFATIPTTSLTDYDGRLVYTPANGSGEIVVENGSAKISKLGDSYTIVFSDEVPSIKGLRFITANGAYASVSTDGSSVGISINNNKLSIGATIAGNSWAFSGNN
ncbi:hypothetical protein [Aquimarina longa]|uniref:hypothetical protein n=1 Tax=Aquimarina longa TaxID=1080221 RepID=UPI000785B891|nr:hypothetical protein [Aquimarina longa]